MKQWYTLLSQWNIKQQNLATATNLFVSCTGNQAILRQWIYLFPPATIEMSYAKPKPNSRCHESFYEIQVWKKCMHYKLPFSFSFFLQIFSSLAFKSNFNFCPRLGDPIYSHPQLVVGLMVKLIILAASTYMTIRFLSEFSMNMHFCCFNFKVQRKGMT